MGGRVDIEASFINVHLNDVCMVSQKGSSGRSSERSLSTILEIKFAETVRVGRKGSFVR